jgi:hypothetical protein
LVRVSGTGNSNAIHRPPLAFAAEIPVVRLPVVESKMLSAAVVGSRGQALETWLGIGQL